MFNFGGNQTSNNLGATSTPAKPTTGNFTFGPPSTTASLGFGSLKPNFGSTSAFGFGATTTTSSTGFGTFGNAPATTTTATNLGSGFNFGTSQASATPLFGNQTTSTNTGFSGFGATNTLNRLGGSTTAPALGAGFGGTTSNSAFGPSGPTTGFGAVASGSGFGGGATSGFGTTTSNTGFGQTGFGTFNSNFGKPAATTSGFGGFGTGFGLQQQPPSLFQTQLQQQQQQQQHQINLDEVFAQAIHSVNLFNDERDIIIAQWNYLQAVWGTGKAYFFNNAPPMDITPENYLCRFKSVSYNRIPGENNKLGYVMIIFNKSLNEIRNHQQTIIQVLNQILGNKPNIVLSIYDVNEIDDKAQLIVYVEEKSLTNPSESKRFLATDLCNYLNQPMFNQHMFNIGIQNIIAFVTPDSEEIEKYLDLAPRGIDERMWNQAKLDNPNPKLFIPVPIIGFKELKKRVEQQELETELHTQYLVKVGNDLFELKNRHIESVAKMNELKRRLAIINHEILKIVSKQECTRKFGISLTADEEILRNKLVNLYAITAAPTLFKGRLGELLSQMRMQNVKRSSVINYSFKLNEYYEEDMIEFLSLQQKAIEFLVSTISKDIKILNGVNETILQERWY